MQAALDTRCGETHAVTDLYCAKRRRALITYSTPLVVAIILTGVAAFLVTGFLGYTDVYHYNLCLSELARPHHAAGLICPFKPAPLRWFDRPFKEPWLLYLWFSGLMVGLEISIMRRLPRRRLIAIIVATLISMLLVGIFYLYGDVLLPYINHLVNGLLANVLESPWFYTVVNFGIILAFFIGSINRWLRRVRGLEPISDMVSATDSDPASTGAATDTPADAVRTPRPAVSSRPLTIGETEVLPPHQLRLEEVIAGDLITGMVLCFVLALLFTYDHISAFVTQVVPGDCKPITKGHITAPGAPTTVCTLPIPDIARVPAQVPLLGHADLFFVDNTLAFLCLFAGFLILAITAVVVSLSAMREDAAGAAGVAGPATDIISVIFSALRAAFDRQFRAIIDYALRSVQNILWPVLILVSSFCLALLSSKIEQYLHAHTLDLATADLWAYYVRWFVGLPVAAVVGTICAISLMLYSGRVLVDALRFVGRIAVIFVFTFWIFAVSLLAANAFIRELGGLGTPQPGYDPTQIGTYCSQPTWQLVFTSAATCNQPFMPFSPLTALSLLALIVALAALLLRTRRVDASARATKAR